MPVPLSPVINTGRIVDLAECSPDITAAFCINSLSRIVDMSRFGRLSCRFSSSPAVSKIVTLSNIRVSDVSHTTALEALRIMRELEAIVSAFGERRIIEGGEHLRHFYSILLLVSNRIHRSWEEYRTGGSPVDGELEIPVDELEYEEELESDGGSMEEVTAGSIISQPLISEQPDPTIEEWDAIGWRTQEGRPQNTIDVSFAQAVEAYRERMQTRYRTDNTAGDLEDGDG